MEQKNKRIKRVFSSTSQVCHVWASQTQDSGRLSSGNVFFEDTSIYSYGYHYKIARIYKLKGQTVAFINNTGYSSSTAKHTCRVHSAVSHLDTLKVECPDSPVESLLNIQDSLLNSLFGILSQNKPYFDYNHGSPYILESIENFNKFCDLLDRPELKLDVTEDTIELLLEHVEQRKQRNKELNSTRQARLLKQYRLKAIAEVKNKYTALESEKNQRHLEDYKRKLEKKTQVKNWLAGQTDRTPRTDLDLIRVKGNTVQTSGGAEVPLNHAVALLKAVLKGTAKPGQRVGHFRLDRLEKNIAVIGCHKVPIGQAQRALKDYINSENTQQSTVIAVDFNKGL